MRHFYLFWHKISAFYLFFVFFCKKFVISVLDTGISLQMPVETRGLSPLLHLNCVCKKDYCVERDNDTLKQGA